MPTFSHPQIIPPFLCLPTELHLDIISFVLDDNQYPSILALRLLNRYFHALIATPDVTLLNNLEQTKFAQDSRHYASRHCLRLRHKPRFVTHWVTPSSVDPVTLTRHIVHHAWARPGFFNNGSHGGWREDMCADCGFDTEKEGRYPPGARFEVDRRYWVWCVDCMEVKKGLDAGMGSCQTSCKACHEGRRKSVKADF